MGGATAPARITAAVALLAGAGLLFEIALTRLLAPLYFNTFVVLLLALAVLGLGLGAAVTLLIPAARRSGAASLWAALAAAAIALSPSLTLVLAAGDGRLLGGALAPLPFLFLGAALSNLFGRYPTASNRLYLADLTGAGLAALLALPLLAALGPPRAVAAAGLLAGVAALLAALDTATLLGGLAGALLAVTGVTGVLPPEFDWRRVATPKPIRSRLVAPPLETRWDALARVDLIEGDNGARYLYLDGGAGSLVPDPDRPQTWQDDIGLFPFVAGRPSSAIVIGPGGGLDLALARLAGTSDLVAVELSRASVEIARQFSPELFAPPTRVLIDEGRSALRRSKRRFDLVFLSQVVTATAEARAIALSENTLYTVEAFHDYLDRLAPGGVIALKLYDEPTLTRALVTAVQALTERGASEPEAAAHLLAVLDTSTDPAVPLLVVHDRPLPLDEAVAWARSAEQLGLALLFVPGLLAAPPLDGLLAGSTSLADIVAASSGVDISPTRDSRPFFWQFEPGVPRIPRLLLISVATALLLLLAAAALRRRTARPVRAAPLLFALLGSGFFLLESAVLQQAQLYLGHPALSLSVTLGGVLLAGGLGSGLAGRLGAHRPWRAAALAALLVAVALAGWTLLWPGLAQATRAAPLPIRSALLLATLLPLALPLGAPFPLALRRAGSWGGAEIALAWTVNGVASLLGALGATVLALRYGFPALSQTALICYLAAALAALALASLDGAEPTGAPQS